MVAPSAIEIVYDFGEVRRKTKHYFLKVASIASSFVAGGELCFAYNRLNIITCWRLSNFRSRDNTVWVCKYVVDVTYVFQKCSEDFGLGGGSNLGMEVQNMVFHPALPYILYLQIRGKVIACDVSTRTVELVYDFGEAWRKTQEYKLFSYEWPQWPRLL
ncbi:uncharacterized protein [Solanum lycopersicum]|uniref:uncharacterized protein isoform X2 n=1 Tax=Solanum lycopersicum TaxID=4081 RepID=UPI000532F6B8|nr:uncharacterized protein LOC101251356 isoform X2 [Solanum lycopersicum]